MMRSKLKMVTDCILFSQSWRAYSSLTQQPAEVVQEAKRPSSEARGDPNTSLATTNGDDDDDDETEESFV